MFRRNYVNGTYTTIVGPLCTIIGSIARFLIRNLMMEMITYKYMLKS